MIARRTILVTREREQAASLTRPLEAAGAAVVAIPTIETVDPPDWLAVDEAVDELANYDAVVFTSANAVARFLNRVHDVASLKNVHAVGPKTADALAMRGVDGVTIASDHRAEGVIESLGEVKGKRVLLPRAKDAREVLPNAIRARGGHIDIVAVYETRPPESSRKALEQQLFAGVDCVTFMSGSAVNNCIMLAGDAASMLKSADIAVIGPVTAGAVRAAGFPVRIQPDEPTAEALAEAVIQYYSSVITDS